MDNIFKIVISIIVVIVLAFNVLLYNFCEQQKNALSLVNEQQKAQTQEAANKFKYQQDQIDHLSKDLEDAQQQVKDQEDALADQKDEDQAIQTSLTDIKAEADAIKEEMKGWQKDYVTVLAQFARKMDDTQSQIKAVGNNLAAMDIPELRENINSLKTEIEKTTQPVDNSASTTPVSQ